VRGFNLMTKLAWDLPDPVEQYEPEITGSYLKKAEFESIGPRALELKDENKTLLKKYDQLLAIGTSGREIQVIKDTSKLSKSLEFALLYAWRLRALEINRWIHTGKSRKAMNQLRTIFAFHLNSLKYPAFLFTTMTHVAILRAIHEFAKAAAADNREFAKLMTPSVKAGLQIIREPGDLLQNSLVWELTWVNRMTKESPAYDEFRDSIIGNPVNLPQKLSKFVLEGPMKFNKRRLLNAIYSCWTDDGRIPFKYQVLFPAVWQLTNTLCSQSSGRLVKLNKELADLRVPL
jgi:hypothetical protein